MFAIISTVFSLLALAPGAQQAGRPTAPPVPMQMAAAERTILAQSAALLSEGRFDQAAALLKPLMPAAAVPVYVDWMPVPRANRAAYRQAVQKALHEWNLGLGEALKFRLTDHEEEADLLLLFEQYAALFNRGVLTLACADTSLENTPSARRTARARIALNVPYTSNPHSAASLTHVVGQALGVYLGLGTTSDPATLMGPDTHSDPAVIRPSAAELQLVGRIQQVRAKLMDFARRRVVVHVSKPVLVAEQMEMDAGDVLKGDSAHYVFVVKNTGDAPLEIFAKPNCGCTLARYDKVIAPGAAGKIEADVKTISFRGRIAKTIEVTSNDPLKPQASLRLMANVVSVVQIVPNNAPNLALKDDGPTEREYEIHLRDTEPVEISRVACSAPHASAKLEPLEGQSDGNRAYKLTLTVQPNAPLGRSGLMVSIFTTSKREPQANLSMLCEKGILPVPASLYLGAIGPNTPLPLSQIVTLARHEGKFHIQKVECSDSNLEVRQETVQDGSQYRLTLTYRGGWSAGVVQSKIAVETDDPRQPRIEIPVLASVIAPVAGTPNP